MAKKVAQKINQKHKLTVDGWINIYKRENGYAVTLNPDGEDSSNFEYVAHSIAEVGEILASVGIK